MAPQQGRIWALEGEGVAGLRVNDQARVPGPAPRSLNLGRQYAGRVRCSAWSARVVVFSLSRLDDWPLVGKRYDSFLDVLVIPGYR